MKNKFQIAMTLAVLLAMVITSLALADTVTSDVDAVVGNQTFIDLGNVTPGQVINSATSFQLVCSGNNHADQGNTVFVQYFSATVPGGTLTASDTTIGPIPVNWADDGGNCSSPAPVLDDNGNSTVTITAPTTAGTYDYAVTYKVCQSNNASLCGGIDPNDVTGAVPAVTFRLKVVTNAAPTITVNDVTNEGNAIGGWTLAFNAIGSASDAEDGTPSVSCTPAIGSVLPLGANNVSCTATDSGGKTATDTGVVTVKDTNKPTIADNSDMILEATGPTGAVANFSKPTASDIVDSSLTVGCVPASGSTFVLGHTTVICTATDDSNNSAQSDFDVFVRDTTPPTIAPHGDETAEATSPAGAVVTYTSPATSDIVSGAGTATCTPASGSQFVLGNTTVTCNASDAAGNPAAQTTFVVHVVDTTPPTFNCGVADSIWHAGNQSVACTASDSGSGLATPATFSLSTNVAAGNETASASTNTADVCDLSGNCVTAGPVGPFKIDRKGPSVSATPDRSADFGGWYNHALTVTFSGSDGGSDNVMCDPAVNYSTPDDASASVFGSCSDAVGNSASASFDFMYDATAPTAALSVTAGIPGANSWYTSDVTIHTSGSGSVSGVTCTPDQDQTSETTGSTFYGSCTSGAGLTTNAAPLTVKLDKTAPTNVVLTAFGTMGNNGWYISDVTITTSGMEDISTPLTCTTSQSQTTDTLGTNFNGTCTNDAGLTTAADSVTIKRDATAPTITGAPDRAANGNGWYNADVTVSFTCGDNLSGVASCTDPTALGEGASQSVLGSVTDKAGNSASTTVSGINIDKTAPVITATLDKTAINGWFNIATGAPTVSFTCSDPLSGLAGVCPDSHLFSDGANQSYNQSISDKAGNTASAGVSGVNVDTVAPSINASVSPTRPASGWWNIASGAPTVSYACSDGTSGIASCSTAYTFPEGENQIHSGTAVDTAGNSASTGVSDIDVDLTAPTLAWVGGPAASGNYYFGSVPAAPTCSAADTLSGQNGCTVTGHGTTVGSHTMTAAAADKAGNTYSETRTYSVLAWNILGFYQPVDMDKVNTAKNGSTVPLKFEVFAGSTELTNTGIVSTFIQKESCVTFTTDDIETYATGGTSLRYDTTGGQFIFNWQTPKVVGGCYKVTLTTQDGTHISADFKLK